MSYFGITTNSRELIVLELFGTTHGRVDSITYQNLKRSSRNFPSIVDGESTGSFPVNRRRSEGPVGDRDDDSPKWRNWRLLKRNLQKFTVGGTHRWRLRHENKKKLKKKYYHCIWIIYAVLVHPFDFLLRFENGYLSSDNTKRFK